MRPIWWLACAYWRKQLECKDSSVPLRCRPCETVLATTPRVNGGAGLDSVMWRPGAGVRARRIDVDGPLLPFDLYP